MSIDLRRALRRVKPDRPRQQLVPRPADELTGADAGQPINVQAVAVDTNVYIRRAAGRLTAGARELVNNTLLFHCNVCLGELVTGIGHADPDHRDWAALRDHYTHLFASIQPTRILTPDDDIWIEAGLIAGVLARTQRYQPNQRKECLNDALIYLTAAKAGLSVLTANRADFDLIQQVAGRGHFIWF